VNKGISVQYPLTAQGLFFLAKENFSYNRKTLAGSGSSRRDQKNKSFPKVVLKKIGLA